MASGKRFLIYGYSGCPWCEKAKNLLTSYGVEPLLCYMEDRADRSAWMDLRGFLGDDRTFPKVYRLDPVGNEHLIGGYDNLEEWLFVNEVEL